MRGRVCLVTGATSCICREAAAALARRGATGIVMLAADPECAAVTRRCFDKGRPARPSAPARDPAAAARLWAVSEILAPIDGAGAATMHQSTDQGGAR